MDFDADIACARDGEEAVGRAVVAEDAVGGVLDDDDVVLFGEGDGPFVELGRRGAAGGAVGVAKDEELGFGADVGGDAVEIGEEVVLGREWELVHDAAVVAGVCAGDGVAGDGHQRDVARIDEAGWQHSEGIFGADARADFGRRVEVDAVFALHEAGRRFAEGGNAVVGVAAVFGFVDFLAHAAADDFGGHRVVFADAEVEQLPFGMVSEPLCAWRA